jgi:hypothetical protein
MLLSCSETGKETGGFKKMAAFKKILKCTNEAVVIYLVTYLDKCITSDFIK